MNYVILNDREIFEDQINLKNFQEVDLYGNERVDAVFCHITKEILDNINQQPTGRDSILPESWLLRNPGLFILSEVDKDVLHHEEEVFIETLFGLYDQEKYYIEIRSYHIPETYNQIKMFVFAYSKNLEFCENLFPEKIENNNIIQTLLENVEKKIL